MNKKINFVAASALLFIVPFLASADTFDRQLEMGMRGDDVSTLQTFLATDPAIYPQGLVTGYFGFLTKAAVSNFQDRNGIAAVGRVGPMTLPVLNSQYASKNIGGGDVYAPVMSPVSVVTASDRAIVSWSTNEAVRGKVYYSTSPIRISNIFDVTGVNSGEPVVSGTLAPYDSTSQTSHSVTITGLAPNTTYYYLAVSIDAMSNFSISLPASFHTN